MNATENLIKDHNAIVVMLSIMDKVADIIREDKMVDIEDVDDIVDFIKIFISSCHHIKEENHLFPALVNKGINSENGQIGNMLIEHSASNKYISNIEDGIVNYKSGYQSSLLQIAQGISNYTFLLRTHINKENNMLFPLADNLLSRETQIELLNKFEQTEEDIVGKSNKFYRLLEQLKDKYVNRIL